MTADISDISVYDSITISDTAAIPLKIIYLFQKFNKLFQCEKCHTGKSMIKNSDTKLVGYIWRCPNRDCRAKKSVLSESYFQSTRLSLQKVLLLIYFWACKSPVTITAMHVDTRQKTSNRLVQLYEGHALMEADAGYHAARWPGLCGSD